MNIFLLKQDTDTEMPSTSKAGLPEESRVISIPIKNFTSKFVFQIRYAMIKREHKLKESPSNKCTT